MTERRYSTGYNGTTRDRAGLLAWSHMQGLDPELQRRVLWILDAAANLGRPIGIGSITRSATQADDLFRSRYHVVTVWRPGAVYFEGKWWALNPGMAPAMPSDRTYHVPMTPTSPKYALAIDFTGDLDMLATLCPRVFMIEFAKVNGEAWHGQGASYPQSRRIFVASLHYPLPSVTLPALPGETGTVKVWAPKPILKQRRGLLAGKNDPVEVRSLQHTANFWGWRDALGRTLIVDGDFGAKTDQAVRNMQRALGVTVDGEYGPQSAGALQKFLDAMAALAAVGR